MDIFTLISQLTPGAALIVVVLYLGTQQIGLMKQVQTDNASFSSKLLEQYSKLDSSINSLDKSIDSRLELQQKQLEATNQLTTLVVKNMDMLENFMEEIKDAKIRT